jgi:hypothetical protein
MTVSDLLESDNQEGCYKLLTACSKLVDNLGQAVGTQLVDGLLADLLQDVRVLRVCIVCLIIHIVYQDIILVWQTKQK